jgi:phage terminase large subunit-like protein
MELTDNDIKHLNDMENFLSWKSSKIFRQFIRCKHKIIALFTGNQFGKTGSVGYQYNMRIMGLHPVPDKNVLYFECASRYCPNGHRHKGMTKNKLCPECGEELDSFSGHAYSIKTRPKDNICTECGERITIHKRKTRTFRFCAETLPNDKGDTGNSSESSEVRNTTYPEFKKWLPPFLIKKDITARNPSMTIFDVNVGNVFGENEDGTPMVYEAGHITVEFVSYNQSTQSTAGVQRLSIWCDEEPPFDFYKEQLPRLYAENGDFINSLTPANYISWTYDELFEKAKTYYRSKAICDFLATQERGRPAEMEETDSCMNIAVIQAATDDNPTLSKAVIEEGSSNYDSDDLAIRRYGIFRQVSGKIFKDFDTNVHVIDGEKWFPDGMPHSFLHARGIDYHSQTPWANGFLALSPNDEAFIYNELNMSPEKYTTREIAMQNALMGGDYKYMLNLIDPFAEATKKDTISVLEDLNRIFYELKKEGVGTGGYWQTWDTKGEKGRDEIRKRLKNAKQVGQPFNNIVMKNGIETRLPTLWMLNHCGTSRQHMKQWRWDEWADPTSRNTKDAKNSPQQKFSHMNMVWEAIFKHPAFRVRKDTSRRERRDYGYFQRVA